MLNEMMGKKIEDEDEVEDEDENEDEEMMQLMILLEKGKVVRWFCAVS